MLLPRLAQALQQRAPGGAAGHLAIEAWAAAKGALIGV